MRLTNGASYTFNAPRDFGATKDFREIFYFTEPADDDGAGWVLIDTEKIVEILSV